ncbi:MAG: hypothetical protein KAW39_00260 [Thermoplasmata archaeon]|nr:hypothetical protein [Thermoplasmata archaeon]
MPSYEEGNSWVYSANMTHSLGFVLAGTLEMAITDTERVYVDSTPYHTIRNEIIGNGTFIGVFEGHNVSGNWTMVGLENWDIVSLEIVRSQTTLVFRGLMDVGVPLNFYLIIQNTTLSDVVLDAWQHPYDVGDSGNVALARTSNETMLVEIEGSAPVYTSTDWNGSVAVTYSCVEYAEITVQAGVFQTHHILRTESNGLVEDNYYSDEVGAGVQIDRSIGGVVVISQWELLSYTYAAAQSPEDEGLPLLYWLIPVAVVIALILAALYIERRRK